ncbi:MAG: TlpA disulfide reductase family protein [Syntrophotaleaceae bacterium]
MAIIAGLLYGGLRRPSPDKANAVVGALAPEFTLTDISGGQLSLGQFRGRNVLIVFWASWCPPCRAEMASLQLLHNSNTVKNLAILAVNAGETQGQVAAFVSQQKLTLPVLLDVENDLQQLYGVYQLPLAFLVDSQGKIVARHLGMRDWNSTEAIAALNRLGRE